MAAFPGVLGLAVLVGSAVAEDSARGVTPNLRGDAATQAAIETALPPAFVWLADFPETDLRFDAAVLLHGVRGSFASPRLDEAWRRARHQAGRDPDHPHHRFFDPTAPTEEAAIGAWSPPAPGGPRVNPNRVLSEAFHCDRRGWLAGVSEYACGPMRDSGGYHTAHALLALSEAHRRGCLSGGVGDCRASLRAEVLAAQPAVLAPGQTLDIDIFAERMMVLLRDGWCGPESRAMVNQLLAAQRPDGSFSVEVADEPAYYAYHATATSLWALAEYRRARVGCTGSSGARKAQD